MGWLEDTFTDADFTALENHTPDVGGTWVKNSSNELIIETNQLHEPNDAFALYNNNQSAPGGNNEAVIDLTATDVGGFWFIQIYLNYDFSTGSGYRAEYARSPRRFIIQRIDNGTVTQLDESAQFNADIPLTFKFRINDGTLEFLHGTTVRASAEDSTYNTGGQFGLKPNGLWLDNLVVTDLGGGTAPTITSAPNTLVRTGSGYSVSGSNFGATQGTGDLTLETADGTTTVVSQTITSWSATQIDFDPVVGGHTVGATDLQLKVTTDGGSADTHTGVTLRHPRVTYAVKNDANVAKADETGVNWWVSESRSSAPVDEGSAGTTNSSGNSTHDLANTTTTPGGVVIVEAKYSDGTYGEFEATVS